MANKPKVVAWYMGDGIVTRCVRASQLVEGSKDPAYPLIRQSEHIAEIGKLVEALKEARDVLAAAIKASAPDYFRTDEDAAKHLTIQKIDRALGGGNDSL